MKKLLTFTYNMLRHLPETRFHRKFMERYARTIGFEEAIAHSEDLTCIDLGANIGTYTRKMAEKAKYVIAFEPDPWAQAELQANVSHINNVRIENAAVGTSEGKVSLYRHAQFDDNPLLYSDIRNRVQSLLARAM